MFYQSQIASLNSHILCLVPYHIEICPIQLGVKQHITFIVYIFNCTQLYGIKYSYQIQIICTHLYCFEYSYQTLKFSTVMRFNTGWLVNYLCFIASQPLWVIWCQILLILIDMWFVKERFVSNIILKRSRAHLFTYSLMDSRIANTNNSIQYQFFVCTQSNGSKYYHQILIILFSIYRLFIDS